VVRIDPQYFRPTEVDELIGDAPRPRQSSAGSRRRALRTGQGNVAADLAIARREAANGKDSV